MQWSAAKNYKKELIKYLKNEENAQNMSKILQKTFKKYIIAQGNSKNFKNAMLEKK